MGGYAVRVVFERKIGELIIHRPQDQSLQSGPYQYIGSWRVCIRCDGHANRVFRASLHPIVHRGAKPQDLRRAVPGNGKFNGRKRGVLDLDLAALDWGNHPIRAVRLAPEHGGEQLDQGLTPDRRILVEPSPVACDAYVEIAARWQVRSFPHLVRCRRNAYLSGTTGWVYLLSRHIPPCLSFKKWEPHCVTATNSAPLHEPTAAELADQIERLGQRLQDARESIGRVIFGQDQVIDQTLITLLAGGHALLIGVPGLAKTRLVETLGTVFGLEDKRVQCTPDLMPADILGSEVLEETDSGRRSFRFIRGPVFCQLLMADEINRASPRTQSALLQAMQEHRVTVGGHPHDLPRPFHVLATQNPLEQEGTYPLPEAQLDRFLMQIDVGYPELHAERNMLLATTGAEESQAVKVMSAEDLMAAQRLVRRVPVGEAVVEAILALVRTGRPDHSEIEEVRAQVAWGPGPRASQSLMLAIRARALLDGRLAPSIDDVIALAGPVLRHRMALNFAARAEGATIDDIIDRLSAPFS
jgi:MoxR-like ATPase